MLLIDESMGGGLMDAIPELPEDSSTQEVKS
jgi:hypothetical protein